MGTYVVLGCFPDHRFAAKNRTGLVVANKFGIPCSETFRIGQHFLLYRGERYVELIKLLNAYGWLYLSPCFNNAPGNWSIWITDTFNFRHVKLNRWRSAHTPEDANSGSNSKLLGICSANVPFFLHHNGRF